MAYSPKARRAISPMGILIASALSALACGSAFASSPMITGGLTSQPIGHYEFCKANPEECSIRTSSRKPLRMTGRVWERIVAVNLAVNRAIRPMNDIDIYGKDEVWAYPTRDVGDCEDYVLEKRRMLVRGGMSFADLLITVVRKPDGEGHAVLTVRTDKGDFILDNLTDTVRPWDQTGYRFLKRQADDHTGRWVTIREGQAPLVGAVE